MTAVFRLDEPGSLWHVAEVGAHRHRTACGLELAGRRVVASDVLPEINAYDLCRLPGCAGEFGPFLPATGRATLGDMGTPADVTARDRATFDDARSTLERLGRDVEHVKRVEVGVETQVVLPLALFDMLVRTLAAAEAGSLDVNRSTAVRTGEWP